MKKFRFSLDTVLEYKRQSLDALMGEHALLLARVREQEAAVERLRRRFAGTNAEYRAKQAAGMTVAEARGYETGLEVLEREIRRQTQMLAELRLQAEAKREEMVAAKQETASIERLREKRLASYNYEVQKSEEQFIDDLVCARGFQRPQAPPVS